MWRKGRGLSFAGLSLPPSRGRGGSTCCKEIRRKQQLGGYFSTYWLHECPTARQPPAHSIRGWISLQLWGCRARICGGGLPRNKPGGLFHLSNATLFWGGYVCSIPAANSSKITCLSSQRLPERKNTWPEKNYTTIPSPRIETVSSSARLFLSSKNTSEFSLVSKEGKSSLTLSRYNHLQNRDKTGPSVSC